MSVPKFEEFLHVVLDVISDGKLYSLQTIQDPIAKKMNLTDKDRKIYTRKGYATQFYNRINWATGYLKKAGLLEVPQRKKFKITSAGIQALQSGKKIDMDYLNTIKTFQDFKLGNSNSFEGKNFNNKPPFSFDNNNQKFSTELISFDSVENNLGVLYCMTTVVPGLIKIGKTTVKNFEDRMYNLERNGYFNVVGLKRHFAIEVEDYDDKEVLLGEIFSKSRVPNSELFALDIDLVVQLLSSFDGKQIYPITETKEKVFQEATKNRAVKANWQKIPNAKYYLNEIRRGFGKVEATMRIENGVFIIEKGSVCAPVTADWIPKIRRNAVIKNNILQQDVECHSPSTAGTVAMGCSCNGWEVWKNDEGQPLNIYRQRLK